MTRGPRHIAMDAVVRRRKRVHGVTMLELVTCMGITALLVGGLASAVRLAYQSLDTPTGATATSLDTNTALDQLNADLRLATGFTERTATAATFTVPDRTGDGLPDTIRYAWAGAGSPLTRTVNGLPSPAATLLGNVQAFSLSYLTKTVQPPIVESAEQVLCSFTASSGTAFPTTTSSWPAEYFKPTLPANAISWKITKIRLTMRQVAGTQGNFSVTVTNVDAAKKPTGTPLETYTKSSSTLPTSAGPVEFPFSTLSGLDPAAGKSFQVRNSSAGVTVNVRYQSSVSPATVGSSFCTSTTSGSTWTTPVTTMSIEYQIYGTITTLGP